MANIKKKGRFNNPPNIFDYASLMQTKNQPNTPAMKIKIPSVKNEAGEEVHHTLTPFAQAIIDKANKKGEA